MKVLHASQLAYDKPTEDLNLAVSKFTTPPLGRIVTTANRLVNDLDKEFMGMVIRPNLVPRHKTVAEANAIRAMKNTQRYKDALALSKALVAFIDNQRKIAEGKL